MLNATLTAAISTLSIVETAFETAQGNLDRCYANRVKPFLADCANDTGYPPLTDMVSFLRSDQGKQLLSNGIIAVRTFVLVVAFLSIASVMGMAMVAAKVFDWAQALWLAKGQDLLDGTVATIRYIRNPQAATRLAKRHLRKWYLLQLTKAKEVAKQLVTKLDEASGVEIATFS